MKKQIFVALLIALPLSACSIINSNIETELVESNLYSLMQADIETTYDFSSQTNKPISYRVIEDEPLCPYMTLKMYLSMIEGLKKDNYNFELTSFASSQIFTVKSGSQTSFVTQIDSSSKTIIRNGDFSDAFITAPDYSKSSLSLGLRTDGEMVKPSKNVMTIDYKKVGFKSINVSNETYFPLSLLENIFAPATGIRHIFNYKRIIQFSDNAQLSKQKYLIDNVITTSNAEMKSYIQGHLMTIPNYLLADRLHSFQFIMEYEYGLKSTRNITSMIEYLERQSFYKDFLSGDLQTRFEAYCKTFALLDDGHTSMRDNDDFPYKGKNTVSPYGPKVTGLYQTVARLSKQRTLTPGQAYYSNDNKLAFFTFDSFTFCRNAYEEDGVTLKKTLSDYNSPDFDTFFYFIKILKEIKEKGTVKDVIIDITTNGGGTLGILFKLLPLISKDNNALFYMRSDVVDGVQKYKLSCDSDQDGLFSYFDSFGSDFNFYILTSSFSFSCGNAFPFIAQKNKIAKIIGITSGGGECTVAESYLPSGEHFLHSSPNHLGWYEGEKFIGDEDGAPVDIEIPESDFYNIEKLQQIIK